MDKLIEKISGIEASASSIMESVNDRKAALAKEMEKKTADLMPSWRPILPKSWNLSEATWKQN